MKSKFFIGAVVVCGLVWGVNGYIAVHKVHNFISSTDSQTHDITLPSTTTPTSDWKTYTDDQIGFTFQYPPYLEDGQFGLLINSDKGDIEVVTTNTTQSLQDNLAFASRQSLDVENIIVAGRNATSIYDKWRHEKTIYIPTSETGTTFVTLNFIPYSVVLGDTLPSLSEDAQVIQGVLSTFKFIDPSSNNNVGLKTLDGGTFSIKYPANWVVQKYDDSGSKFWQIASGPSSSTSTPANLPPMGNMWLDITTPGVCDYISNIYSPHGYQGSLTERSFCMNTIPRLQITLGLWTADSNLNNHKEELEKIFSTFEIKTNQ